MLYGEIYDTAYQQGRMALFGGQGRFQNPYDPVNEVLAHGAWEDGYEEAAAEKMEAEYYGKQGSQQD